MCVLFSVGKCPFSVTFAILTQRFWTFSNREQNKHIENKKKKKKKAEKKIKTSWG